MISPARGLMMDLEMYQIMVDCQESFSKSFVAGEEQSEALAKTQESIDGLKRLIIKDVGFLQMHGCTPEATIRQFYKREFESNPQESNRQALIDKMKRSIADVKEITLGDRT